MKNTEFIVLGLAGLAVWFIVRGRQGGAASPVPATQYRATEEVFAAGGGAWDNGWRYFTDGGAGYAIGPDGGYYKDGVRVWAPV